MRSGTAIRHQGRSSAPEAWGLNGEDFEPICELALSNGGRLIFVEEGRGDGKAVGIIELANDAGHRVLPAFIQAFGATPLEIYRAFMPHRGHPPRALIEDHIRAGRQRPMVSREPRILAKFESPPGRCIFLPHTVVADPAPRSGIVVEACEPEAYSARFRALLAEEFGGGLPHHARGEHLRPSQRGVTGLSSRRALGLLNSAAVATPAPPLQLDISIECEWSRDVWVKVASVPDQVSAGKSVTYFSDSWPLLLRYRITVTQSGEPAEIAHLEGAW
jgi:hypothetical protein